MKLVMAVISNKDVSKVLDAITKEGFSSSRISTTGQFLADGHTTLFIGTEDHKVEQLFDVLGKHVTKRVWPARWKARCCVSRWTWRNTALWRL